MKPIFPINTWILESTGFVGAVRSGRVKGRAMFIETGWTALWYFGLVLLSFITFWPFKGEPLWKPASPMWVWLVAAVVVIVLYLFYFLKRKKHFADIVSATAIRKSAAGSGASKYCYALLFAGMLVASVVTGVRAVGGDSFIHLLVPMATVLLVLLLNRLTHWRFWFLLGALLLLGYAVLMIQNMLAVTNFTYTPLLAMIPLFLSAILPLGALAFIKQK